MAQKFVFNPITGSLDKVIDPVEGLSHSELADMPDSSGLNSDHDARYVLKSGSITQINQRSHNDLQDIGVYSHPQIDSHINSNHVNSFNGRTGIVVPATGDYSLDQISNRLHSLLSGLSSDDHTQYLLLAGRTGGQIIYGGIGASENLTLSSTSHATKGKIIFGNSVYDEVNNRLGIGTTAPQSHIHINNNTSFSELRIQGGISSDTGLRIISSDRTWKLGINLGSIGAGKFSIYDITGASTRLTIDTSGNVGIGTTSPTSKLHILGTINSETADLLNSGTQQITAYLNTRANTSTTSYNTGVYSMVRRYVSSNYTDSGWISGITSESFAGYSGVHSGTLKDLYGIRSMFGIFNTNNTGTINNCYGIQVYPYSQSGTITNLYGLYISNKDGAGVVSNYYGIYQEDKSAKNYFAGNVGIGMNNDPLVALHIEPEMVNAHGGTGVGLRFLYTKTGDYQQSVACAYVTQKPNSGQTFSWDTNSFRNIVVHDGAGTSADLAAFRLDVGAGGNGSVTNLSAMKLVLPISLSTFSTKVATITNLYGIRMFPGTISGTNLTIQNFYGIIIASPDTGNGVVITGNNYSIYAPHIQQRLYHAGNVSIGIDVSDTKLLVYDTNGYKQFRIYTPYTPTSTSDTNGSTGTIVWDNNYIYVKTSSGWKRAQLSTF